MIDSKRTTTAHHQIRLPLQRVHGGKVRDVYHVGADRLLMVASDRVSAFDVVMDEPVPRKGEVLTLLTAWWLDRLEHLGPHHLISAHPADILRAVPALAEADPDLWARRSMLVRRTEPIPVECVARGYLSGSAWKEYSQTGTLAGEPLPAGLTHSQQLPSVLFSPATKAKEGHDENIPVREVAQGVGPELATELERRTRALYREGSKTAADNGIILADTKFEFGRAEDGALLLIDEVLTPDSSRYWPMETYQPGRVQPSLDKQPVRDFLETLEWDKTPPPPALPDSVIQETTGRYEEIFRRLVGSELEDWDPPRVPSAGKRF